MNIDAQAFTEEWIDAWNSHDLDAILAHYTDDFQITTPMIKIALGLDTGTLKGKSQIRNYWLQALQKMPDLKFELIDVTTGVDSIALFYRSVMNKRAIEVMFFNDENKVYQVMAHYTD